MIKNRQNQILTLLTTENRIDVATLAGKLDVSEVTIRKDLDELEKQGIVVREHGFATLRSKDDISGRLAYHYEEKMQIAKKAAELVQDGENVMIESGSCCALLAEILVKTKKNLTIITNSAYIADHIRHESNFDIILLGGIYQKDAQAMVGPMVRQCVDNFYVDHFFIGVDGYTEKTGFTHANQLRAQAVRDMARQAGQVIVLTESEKFGKRGAVALNLSDIELKVITDNKVQKEFVEALSKHDIELVIE